MIKVWFYKIHLTQLDYSQISYPTVCINPTAFILLFLFALRGAPACAACSLALRNYASRRAPMQALNETLAPHFKNKTAFFSADRQLPGLPYHAQIRRFNKLDPPPFPPALSLSTAPVSNTH